MSSRTAPKSSQARLALEEIAMEMERDGMGRRRPRQLLEARRVEHEQEGTALVDVENDRQQHPVVLRGGGRGRHEHRLARIESRRVPASTSAGSGVDLDDAIEKIAFGRDARAPDIAVGLAGMALVIDAGQFERQVDQSSA